MAIKNLNEELFDEPYRFEFFQAVRLLEKMFPEHRAVGREASVTPETVRFRSRLAVDFPASEIHELKETNDESLDEQRLEMFVNFMGMIGVSGAMPTHYTELAMERRRYQDTTMWSFMDIFTHRAVSLFFRAWEKYRFPIGYERGQDDFTAFLFDFAGLGTAGLRDRMSLPDESLLPYSGLIAQKPHSAIALANILSDYFGIKAKIQQFFGQWLELDTESVTQLGQTNSSLGASAIIGTRIWEQQSKFRVRLGAMSFKEFQDFLPNGAAHQSLKSVIRFMVGLELDFDVQLVLQAKQVPGTILTTRAMRRPMLGWTSFLKTKPFLKDDEQVIMQTL